MTKAQAATITAAERALAVLLSEWGVSDSGRRAADAVSLVVRHGLRPTAARPAVPTHRSGGVRDASIARRGAEHARRLLTARTREDE
ncbi:hypothetical protein HII36_02340 [Nonomuraea sp. NN258]|uniref:hypothetical protein n=1 Tax=Nonomuraea antri TaxID=2730852 RepID=UPI00156A0984|nr:hypothetical protein [Nonomuraea antri]NRQ30679.1 hypothetical protein [Nonomuraea antri]